MLSNSVASGKMFIPVLFFLFHTYLQLTSEIEKNFIIKLELSSFILRYLWLQTDPWFSEKVKTKLRLMSKGIIVQGVSTINPFGVFLLITTPP